MDSKDGFVIAFTLLATISAGQVIEHTVSASIRRVSGHRRSIYAYGLQRRLLGHVSEGSLGNVLGLRSAGADHGIYSWSQLWLSVKLVASFRKRSVVHPYIAEPRWHFLAVPGNGI